MLSRRDEIELLSVSSKREAMRNYLQPLSEMFLQAANPADAVFMKKYMLNQFEYFGIRSPKQREIRRKFLNIYGLPGTSEIASLVKELWQQPEREYQYFGVDLSERMLRKLDESAIEVIEFMIVNKSWWDTVDWVASHHAGMYLIKYPGLINDTTETWMSSGNIWLQRTALLFQLKYKKDTNETLLYSFILRLKDSREFFIRKAIGWALREYSKISPASVLSFVENNSLSGLSHREALKWIERKRSHE